MLATQAARQAAQAPNPAAVLTRFQVMAARLAERSLGLILREQRITAPPEARLDLSAWTTGQPEFRAMADETNTRAEFERLVSSIVQDTGRAAQQAAVTAREEVGWTRYLTLPSCGRCVVLAGRVYLWSDGFMRHPNDDCVTLPVFEGDETFTADGTELARTGQVSGLSKADRKAVAEGADLADVTNLRRRSAGLSEAGRVLTRGDRPTPEGIYRLASDRAEALGLLQRFGYVR